ncbi:MAG: hypothetical protein HON78_01185 [Legionellales bacterium]|nr:hypothetical protein [Legionellales bacterium]
MSDYFKDNEESVPFNEEDKKLHDEIISIYRSHFPDQDIPSYWVLNGKGGPTKTMPIPVNIGANIESYIDSLDESGDTINQQYANILGTILTLLKSLSHRHTNWATNYAKAEGIFNKRKVIRADGPEIMFFLSLIDFIKLSSTAITNEELILSKTKIAIKYCSQIITSAIYFHDDTKNTNPCGTIETIVAYLNNILSVTQNKIDGRKLNEKLDKLISKISTFKLVASPLIYGCNAHAKSGNGSDTEGYLKEEANAEIKAVRDTLVGAALKSTLIKFKEGNSTLESVRQHLVHNASNEEVFNKTSYGSHGQLTDPKKIRCKDLAIKILQEAYELHYVIQTLNETKLISSMTGYLWMYSQEGGLYALETILEKTSGLCASLRANYDKFAKIHENMAAQKRKTKSDSHYCIKAGQTVINYKQSVDANPLSKKRDISEEISEIHASILSEINHYQTDDTVLEEDKAKAYAWFGNIYEMLPNTEGLPEEEKLLIDAKKAALSRQRGKYIASSSAGEAAPSPANSSRSTPRGAGSERAVTGYGKKSKDLLTFIRLFESADIEAFDETGIGSDILELKHKSIDSKVKEGLLESLRNSFITPYAGVVNMYLPWFSSFKGLCPWKHSRLALLYYKVNIAIRFIESKPDLLISEIKAIEYFFQKKFTLVFNEFIGTCGYNDIELKQDALHIEEHDGRIIIKVASDGGLGYACHIHTNAITDSSYNLLAESMLAASHRKSDDLDKALKKTKKTVAKHEETIADQQVSLDKKEEVISQKEEVISQKEEVISQKEEVISQKEEVNTQLRAELDQQGEVVSQKEEVNTQLRAELDQQVEVVGQLLENQENQKIEIAELKKLAEDLLAARGQGVASSNQTGHNHGIFAR